MTNKALRPENFSWLSPYLTVSDIQKSIDFYQNIFNISPSNIANDDDGVPVHAELRYQDQTLMIGKQGAYGSKVKTPAESGVDGPICLYLYCENVDKLCEKARAAGAKILSEPADMFWGDRTSQICDRDGHVWCFATHNPHVHNEHCKHD